jgi:hypothetical protein
MERWEKMSNAEIRMKMSSMEMVYESIKNKINNLVSELDKLDIDYDNAQKELNKRSKK